MVIGFSFPICPAGIMRVYRVPCALTPAIVCVPRSSFLKFPLAAAFASQDSALPFHAPCLSPGVPPFILPNGCPIFSAVFSSGCRIKFCCATGSLIITNDLGPPEVASGPMAGSVTSLRNRDRKSTRLNSSHGYISYAVFCLKKKKQIDNHYLSQENSI